MQECNSWALLHFKGWFDWDLHEGGNRAIVSCVRNILLVIQWPARSKLFQKEGQLHVLGHVLQKKNISASNASSEKEFHLWWIYRTVFSKKFDIIDIKGTKATRRASIATWTTKEIVGKMRAPSWRVQDSWIPRRVEWLKYWMPSWPQSSPARLIFRNLRSQRAEGRSCMEEDQIREYRVESYLTSSLTMWTMGYSVPSLNLWTPLTLWKWGWESCSCSVWWKEGPQCLSTSDGRV